MSEIEQGLNSLSVSFVETLYANYLRDAESVSPDWRHYFDELSHGNGNPNGAGNGCGGNSREKVGGNGNGKSAGAVASNGGVQLGPDFRPTSFFAAPPVGDRRGQQRPLPQLFNRARRIARFARPQPPRPTAEDSATQESLQMAVLQDRVDQLVRAYRVRGHLVAQVDPLGLPRPELPELDPRTYHFTRRRSDLPRFPPTRSKSPQVMTLRRVIELAAESLTAGRSAMHQFMHIDDLKVCQWLQVRMEGSENRLVFACRRE